MASRSYHLESVVNRLDYLNKHVSEHGDVQSAVSMYLVLGGGRAGDAVGVERTKGLIDNAVLEHWFLSYIELLQRLQLFPIANEVNILLRFIFCTF